MRCGSDGAGQNPPQRFFLASTISTTTNFTCANLDPRFLIPVAAASTACCAYPISARYSLWCASSCALSSAPMQRHCTTPSRSRTCWR